MMYVSNSPTPHPRFPGQLLTTRVSSAVRCPHSRCGLREVGSQLDSSVLNLIGHLPIRRLEKRFSSAFGQVSNCSTMVSVFFFELRQTCALVQTGSPSQGTSCPLKTSASTCESVQVLTWCLPFI